MGATLWSYSFLSVQKAMLGTFLGVVLESLLLLLLLLRLLLLRLLRRLLLLLLLQACSGSCFVVNKI